MELAVASHYAKAMAELVTRAGSAVPARDAVEQVRSFEDLVASSHDLRGVLLSPAVSGGRKRAIVAKLGGKLGVSPLVLNFLYVIINHRRIGILAEIRQSLEAHIDELMGVVRAEIRSASPLTEPQRMALQGELSGLTGKQVRMEYGTDDALIGGVTAKVGSTVYDGSVRGRLDALRRRLATE